MKKNTDAAAPVNNAQAIIGSIGMKVVAHWTKPGVFVLQARDIRFDFPRAENVIAAAKLIGVDLAGAVVEGNNGGMFARVELTEAQLKAGNVLACWLAQGAEEIALADVAKNAEAAAEA